MARLINVKAGSWPALLGVAGGLIKPSVSFFRASHTTRIAAALLFSLLFSSNLFASPTFLFPDENKPAVQDDDLTSLTKEYSFEDIIIVEVTDRGRGLSGFVEFVSADGVLLTDLNQFLEFAGHNFGVTEQGVVQLDLNGNGWIRINTTLFEIETPDLTEALDEFEFLRIDRQFFLSMERLANTLAITYEFNPNTLRLRMSIDGASLNGNGNGNGNGFRSSNGSSNGNGYGNGFRPVSSRTTVSNSQQMLEAAVMVENPYSLIDFPFIDISATSSVFGRGDETRQDWRYFARGSGDLLWLNSEWSISGREGRPADFVRFRAGRRSLEPDLLGIAATHFYVGDLNTSSRSAVANSRQGRGVEVGNQPLEFSSDFAPTQIPVNVAPGAQVELYQNGELIAVGNADPQTGFFEFTDVMLVYGQNIFQLVSIDQAGQMQQKSIRRYVGRRQQRPGQLQYRFSAIQQNTPLFELHERSNIQNLDGEARLFGEFDLGLNRTFSLNSWSYSLPLPDGRHNYLAGGVSASFALADLRASYIHDFNSGFALQGAGRFRLGRWSVAAEHTRMFDDFSSEADFAFVRNYSSISNFSLSGRLPFGIQNQINVQDFRFDEGRSITRVQHRLSRNILGLFVSHNLSLIYNETSAGPQFGRGQLLMRYRNAAFQPKARAGYLLRPRTELSDASAGFDWQLNRNTYVSAEAGYQFSFIDNAFFQAGFTRSFGYFNLSINGNYTFDNFYYTGITLSTGLVRNPTRGRLQFSERSVSQLSGISGDLYHDIPHTNPGRAMVHDASLEFFPAVSSTSTQAEGGRVFRSDVRAWSRQTVRINPSTVEDPALQIPSESISYLSRPGKIFRQDFRIDVVSEIEGLILAEGKPESKPAPVRGVPVTLQRQEDNERMVQFSDYDGYFLFDGIKTGTYLLTVPQEWLDRNKFELTEENEIYMVYGDGELFLDQNLILRPVVTKADREEMLAEEQRFRQELRDSGMWLPCDEMPGFEPAYFGFNSYTLDEEARKIVQRHAQFLNEYPQITVLVEGFADSVGYEEYNERLSRRRAWAMQAALTEFGVHPDRILVRGRGEVSEECPTGEETAAGCAGHRKAASLTYTVFESVRIENGSTFVTDPNLEKLARNLSLLKACQELKVRVETLAAGGIMNAQDYASLLDQQLRLRQFYADQGISADRISVEGPNTSRFEFIDAAQASARAQDEILTTDAGLPSLASRERTRPMFTVQIGSSATLAGAGRMLGNLQPKVQTALKIVFKPEQQVYAIVLDMEGTSFQAERFLYSMRTASDFRGVFLVPTSTFETVTLAEGTQHEMRYGAFSSQKTAKKIAEQINAFASVKAEVKTDETGELYRIVSERAVDNQLGQQLMAEARQNGYYDILLITIRD
ncbi:MAG: OmpA family protein [Balneolales bacterium]|nr:OmpA family protein [Balneolales bacterium]